MLALESAEVVAEDSVAALKRTLMLFLDRRTDLQRYSFVEERDPRLRQFRMRYVPQMELERSFEAQFPLEV